MTVYGLKLTSGEEILASTTQNLDVISSEDYIVLTNPVQIVFAPGPDGRPQLGMQDYLMFAKEESAGKKLKIHKAHVLFHYNPDTKLVNGYNQMYGSGIVIPESSSILSFPKK